MFNKFLNNIKKFGSQISELENNVTGERDKFMEVFERNLILEKEIAERTEELSQANKSILTLKHIWGTMNSSEPLSEVLKTIVNGLTEDLGYLHGVIFQLYQVDDHKELKIRVESQNEFTEKIKNIIGESISEFSIPIEQKHNVLVDAINRKEIVNINSFGQIFENAIIRVDDTRIYELDKLFRNRSISILPINSQDSSNPSSPPMDSTSSRPICFRTSDKRSQVTT